jgi:hypothetical protein
MKFFYFCIVCAIGSETAVIKYRSKFLNERSITCYLRIQDSDKNIFYRSLQETTQTVKSVNSLQKHLHFNSYFYLYY